MDTSRGVTVVITCCGRLGLLRKTLKSFNKFNTYPIKEFIIIDDSGDKTIHQTLIKEYAHKLSDTTLILNKENIGQSKSIDKAYRLVKTPYIFHLEEDWKFTKEGFIEKSFELMDTDPKMVTVWLRGLRNTSGHTWHDKLLDFNGIKYHRLRVHKGTFSGYTWNPGLRRTKDYRTVEPFGNITEEKASSWFGSLGYYAVILTDIYVKHTGYLNSTQNESKT